MNILWFCEDFYPYGGVGFVRIVNLVRAQQERGNQIAVVCTRNDDFCKDYELWDCVNIDDIRMIRTPVATKSDLTKSTKLMVLFSRYPHVVIYPWSALGVEHAIRYLPSGWADVVCASGPRWGGVVAAWTYSLLFNCPLHVDYRDPFLGPNHNAETRAGKLLNWRFMGIEKQWLQRAGLVTVISSAFEWSIKRLHPLTENLVSLPNGFYETSGNAVPAEFKDYNINLLFTGTVRDAFMFRFLNDLSATISDRFPDKKCCLWVLGMNASGLPTTDAAFNYLGFQSHGMVKRFQEHADLLVHVLGPGVEGRYDSLSGKVWEYIGQSAPILCVSPADSTAGRFVEAENRGRATNGYSVESAGAIAEDLLKNADRYYGNMDNLVQKYAWHSIRELYWNQILAAVADSKQG